MRFASPIAFAILAAAYLAGGIALIALHYEILGFCGIGISLFFGIMVLGAAETAPVEDKPAQNSVQTRSKW